jgi:hypothetical protein
MTTCAVIRTVPTIATASEQDTFSPAPIAGGMAPHGLTGGDTTPPSAGQQWW